MSPEAAWNEYTTILKRLNEQVAQGVSPSTEQWEALRPLLEMLRARALQAPDMAARP